MRPDRTVVIAGAGIGGLTAALALARAGFGVTVMERAPGLSEAGAGIQISPNAGRVLARLGLEDEMAARSHAPDWLEIRSGRSGRRLAALPVGQLGRRYGVPHRTMRRADLQSMLAARARLHREIDLRFGQTVVEFGVHANGVTVMAADGDGVSDTRATAFVAADGLHSPTRAAMPGGRGALASGRVAWRAVVPAGAAGGCGIPVDRVVLWLGRAGHVVHYPLAGGAALNIVAIIDGALRDGAGWSEPGNREDLLGPLRRWAPALLSALEVAEAWRCWPIATVDPSGPWSIGPIALLGDAAHAMAPYLAQGGAMAVEDAAVLARELAALPDDPAIAFRRYEGARRGRVTRAWRASNAAGTIYHMGAFAGPFRDAVMAGLGGRILLARYNWLYRWTA